MARGKIRPNGAGRVDRQSLMPLKPTPPPGYGNYSDPSTRDAQRSTDRGFDRQEYDYNEQMKRSK